MSAPENPPAFPRDHKHAGEAGMSLRDYFAAQAMGAGMRALGEGYVSAETYAEDWFNFVAEESYRMADALLAERAKVRS